ncbi:MAG: type II toxin-antitoxin system RelE/ParE family toxin [Chloroflexi bacterium]|nr:type II toxin-antitoxin system RelE/ParE family toxin [Chloroflexota bacterium]
MYAVEFLPSAARVLSKLEPPVRRRIVRRIDRLAEDPRGDAVKLRGADDVWRARAGDYRILYQVEDDRLRILVIRIGHRRDVYR